MWWSLLFGPLLNMRCGKGWLTVAPLPPPLPPSPLPRASPTYHQTQSVAVSPLGTFDASISVPASATYGTATLSFVRMSGPSGSASTVTSVQLIVADPRPPTVVLNLTSPATFLLTSSPVVVVNATTASYLGQPSPGSTVTLQWRVVRKPVTTWWWGLPRYRAGDDSMPLASSTSTSASTSTSTTAGSVVFVTDEAGAGFVVVDVGSLMPADAPLVDGDSVQVTGVWVGPTGERVTETLTFPVADASLRIATESPSLPLPGIPFQTTVQVASVGPLAQASSPTATVQLALYPWPQATQVTLRDSSTGEAVPFGVPRAPGPVVVAPGPVVGTPWSPNPVATCTVTVTVQASLDTSSGGGPGVGQCVLTLPDMGRYALVASTGTGTSTVASAVPLGRTQEEWSSQPLAALDTTLQLFTDKTLYHGGDVARISFYNPLPQARAMAVLASPSATSPSTPEVSVPMVGAAPGPVTLDFPVTSACGANCELTIVLTSAQDVHLPVPVPLSLLLVGNARCLRASVPIHVASTAPMVTGRPLGTLPTTSIAVDVAASAAPGDTVPLTITVTAAGGSPLQGAEVAVVVVDQAMLDLKPLPLPDLALAFTPLPLGSGAQVHGPWAMLLALSLPPPLGPAYPRPNCGRTPPPQPLTTTTSTPFSLPTRLLFDLPLQVFDSREDLGSLAGYGASSAVFGRRMAADPWVLPSWSLLPTPWTSPEVDVNDAVYFARRTSAITEGVRVQYEMGYVGQGGGGAMGGGVFIGSAGGGGGVAESTTTAVAGGAWRA